MLASKLEIGQTPAAEQTPQDTFRHRGVFAQSTSTPRHMRRCILLALVILCLLHRQVTVYSLSRKERGSFAPHSLHRPEAHVPGAMMWPQTGHWKRRTRTNRRTLPGT